MSDVYAGSYGLDDTAPDVFNQVPAPGATGVAVNSNIDFDILDDAFGDGVDLSSIDVLVDGVPAVVGGVIQVGFTGSVSASGNGYHVTLNPDDDYGPLTLVPVQVDARDLADPANVMTTVTWSFTTGGVLVLGTPVLSAIALDSRVGLNWTIPAGMIVSEFFLRRSTDAAPTTIAEGTQVFQGASQFYLDLNVVNGTRYYYTVFAELPDASIFPYDQLASASALPRRVSSVTPLLPEYVPARGEFGRTVNPMPYGTTLEIWGDIVGRTRRQSDLIDTPPSRSVQAPAGGVVTRVDESPLSVGAEILSLVEITTDSGLALTLNGVFALSSVVQGRRVEAGQVIGRTTGDSVEFSIIKLPTGSFGRRSVRPLYFYLAVENREFER